MSTEKIEKLVSLSEMIFSYAEVLRETDDDLLADSPIINQIIIACLKFKHASGVPPQEALSIIKKLTA